MDDQKPMVWICFINRLCSFFRSPNLPSRKLFFFSILSLSNLKPPTSSVSWVTVWYAESNLFIIYRL